MPAYVDTSALVKRYVAEIGSAWVRRLLAHPAQYVIYTSALSQVEVISALQRGPKPTLVSPAANSHITLYP